jgi:hypothetical protein
MNKSMPILDEIETLYSIMLNDEFIIHEADYERFHELAHHWHMSTDDGILELLKNPAYGLNIYNHSCFDHDVSHCFEAVYEYIIKPTKGPMP